MRPLSMLHMGLVPSELLDGHIWQPFTYLLLHDPINPSHLLLNLLMLWIFGAELEHLWGMRRFLRFFLFCGLGGALGVLLLALVFRSEYHQLVIGASGAVYGMMGAYGTLFKERVLWPIPIKAKHLVLIILGLTVLSFLVRSSESFGAHLGGLLMGLLLTRRRGSGRSLRLVRPTGSRPQGKAGNGSMLN